MLLLETFETVGGIWLALSAVAFVLAAAVVSTRQKSASRDGLVRRQLDLVATSEKRTVPKEAPSRKAA
jgi:hypothetical protein